MRSDTSLWLRDRPASAPAARVSRDELIARVLAQAGKQQEQPVVIAADKNARYEDVLGMLDLLQRNGVKKVGLLARPPRDADVARRPSAASHARRRARGKWTARSCWRSRVQPRCSSRVLVFSVYVAEPRARGRDAPSCTRRRRRSRAAAKPEPAAAADPSRRSRSRKPEPPPPEARAAAQGREARSARRGHRAQGEAGAERRQREGRPKQERARKRGRSEAQEDKRQAEQKREQQRESDAMREQATRDEQRARPKRDAQQKRAGGARGAGRASGEARGQRARSAARAPQPTQRRSREADWIRRIQAKVRATSIAAARHRRAIRRPSSTWCSCRPERSSTCSCGSRAACAPTTRRCSARSSSRRRCRGPTAPSCSSAS